jgi:hypothetical protein
MSKVENALIMDNSDLEIKMWVQIIALWRDRAMAEMHIGQGVQWRGRTGTVVELYDGKAKIRFDDNLETSNPILVEFVQPSTHVALPVKVTKASQDTKQFLLMSKEQPALLEELRRASDVVVRWSCGTTHDAHLKSADNLARMAAISREQALSCINFEDCGAAHDLKAYALFSKKDVDSDSLAKLGSYFKVKPYGASTWQVNSLAVTKWLIEKCGLLPTKKG